MQFFNVPMLLLFFAIVIIALGPGRLAVYGLMLAHRLHYLYCRVAKRNRKQPATRAEHH